MARRRHPRRPLSDRSQPPDRAFPRAGAARNALRHVVLGLRRLDLVAARRRRLLLAPSFRRARRRASPRVRFALRGRHRRLGRGLERDALLGNGPQRAGAHLRRPRNGAGGRSPATRHRASLRGLRAAHGADGLRPRSRDASRGRPNGRAGSGRTPRQGPPQERRVGSDGVRGRLDARGGLDPAVFPCSSRVGISSRSAGARLCRPRRGSVQWPRTDGLVRHLRRIRDGRGQRRHRQYRPRSRGDCDLQRSARDYLAHVAHGPGALARFSCRRFWTVNRVGC